MNFNSVFFEFVKWSGRATELIVNHIFVCIIVLTHGYTDVRKRDGTSTDITFLDHKISGNILGRAHSHARHFSMPRNTRTTCHTHAHSHSHSIWRESLARIRSSGHFHLSLWRERESRASNIMHTWSESTNTYTSHWNWRWLDWQRRLKFENILPLACLPDCLGHDFSMGRTPCTAMMRPWQSQLRRLQWLAIASSHHTKFGRVQRTAMPSKALWPTYLADNINGEHIIIKYARCVLCMRVCSDSFVTLLS